MERLLRELAALGFAPEDVGVTCVMFLAGSPTHHSHSHGEGS